jgi:hypothetical protein
VRCALSGSWSTREPSGSCGTAPVHGPKSLVALPVNHAYLCPVMTSWRNSSGQVGTHPGIPIGHAELESAAPGSGLGRGENNAS